MMHVPTPLDIVLWKWRDPRKTHIIFDYSADAVNRKRRELARFLKLPHRVTCITDDAAGLDSDIRVIPLWDDARSLGGCWTRLKAFAPEMVEVIGPRFAWIDLDSVIVGDVTPLFARPEPLVLYRSESARNTHYNGSMLMMDAGCRSDVWARFDPAASPAIVKAEDRVGTDQAWLSHVLGPDQPVWSRRDGVMHFALDCPQGLPDAARIVFFPGRYKPHMQIVQNDAPWIAPFMAC